MKGKELDKAGKTRSTTGGRPVSDLSNEVSELDQWPLHTTSRDYDIRHRACGRKAPCIAPAVYTYRVSPAAANISCSVVEPASRKGYISPQGRAHVAAAAL